MGMATDQLLAAVVGNLAEGADAALLQQKRKEVDLEENVTELVNESLVVSRIGGVGQFVGLLDGVRDDCPLGLFAIPRALGAEASGQLVETPQ
ncbi:unannotated protein [freshwater metagenome]|uniref:Unannotated protein n=1 Tax=freshwater metagenome TaxID=449393 RepID=A0A6J7S0W5_9ZZZZ